jgi:hypothetical protein
MPTNWDEQDSAFFGELHHDSKPSADEELAKRLQKQFSTNKKQEADWKNKKIESLHKS